MVATRWPAFRSATAMCRPVVDLPDPPFSFPSTTTWAEPDCPWLVCTSMFSTSYDHLRVTVVCGQGKCIIIVNPRGCIPQLLLGCARFPTLHLMRRRANRRIQPG